MLAVLDVCLHDYGFNIIVCSILNCVQTKTWLLYYPLPCNIIHTHSRHHDFLNMISMTFSSKAFPSVVYLGGNDDDDSLIPCAGPGDPDPNSPTKNI